ncbi:MAG: DUF2892 domain-containing protein [Verrucomicrobiota bacterium]
MIKRRIHDGVVGVLILGALGLGYYVHESAYWVLVGLGGLLIQSAFTCFCPVYFILDKIFK